MVSIKKKIIQNLKEIIINFKDIKIFIMAYYKEFK
jgi:hypothetical protein